MKFTKQIHMPNSSISDRVLVRSLMRYVKSPEELQSIIRNLPDKDQSDRIDSALKEDNLLRRSHAQIWRHARANYFKAEDSVRNAIRAKWMLWKGPRSAEYFAWTVTVVEYDSRRKMHFADGEELNAKIN